MVPLAGHVGFDSLPDQLMSESVSQGFCFNILCVGETGLGKSTLMDTLFNTKVKGEPATHTHRESSSGPTPTSFKRAPWG